MSAPEPCVAAAPPPAIDPEKAYEAWMDAECNVSSYAYSATDIRKELEELEKKEKEEGADALGGADALAKKKEELSSDLEEVEALYMKWCAIAAEAEKVYQAVGPTMEELMAEAAEEEYFDVTESCADW